MQDELQVERPDLDITLFGVNAAGLEAGNELAVAGRDMGLLQDTVGVNVWGSWQVVWRDFVILDENNEVVAVYNLTTYNLSNATYYAEVKDALIAAGEALPP